MRDHGEEFYAECRVFVHRLAGRMFSRDEADDITQEVMLRLVRHLPHLDLSESIRPWLATVTRTVGISGRRARRDLPTDGDALAVNLDPQPDLPALTVERADQLHFLRAALRRLSRSDAELLSQHEFTGLPLTEIARAEGVEPAAVRKRLSRARQRLGQHYFALGGPRAVGPLVPAIQWLRARRRPRRTGALAAGAALAVLAAALIGDGDHRLVPRPIPVPRTLPPSDVPGQADLPATATRATAAETRAAVRPVAGAEGAVQVSWERLDTGTQDRPRPRRDASMVYDEARDEYVLFGGMDEARDEFGDTWTSPDGVHWTQRTTPFALNGRAGATMFYDAARRQVVLAGGSAPVLDAAGGRTGSHQRAQRTWVWDGSLWSVLPESDSAESLVEMPYDSAAAAYDRLTGIGLQFGGQSWSGTEPRALTRIWDGDRWQSVAPRHVPPAREGAAMTADPARGQMVLFGGTTVGGRLLDDTWLWDGTDWRAVRPARSPSPRQLARMVTTGRGPVLIGGYDGKRNLTDAWLWTGTDWQPLAVGARAPKVSGAAVAYNPDRREVLLFSGDLAAKSRRQASSSSGPYIDLTETTFVATITGDRALTGSAAPAPPDPIVPPVPLDSDDVPAVVRKPLRMLP